LALLRQSLRIGAELVASHMVIHSPFTTFGSPYITHSSKSYKQREIVTVQGLLEKLLPMAERVKCQLVIENIYDTNPALLIELVSGIDSPYLGLSIDTGHAYLTSLIGGPSPDQWIRETGPWLGHVHLQDTDGLADRHWKIGRGRINWYAVFDALSEVETGPRLILEMRKLDDIATSQRWLAEQGLAG
jgi:sugar phosphate isomerase/epimerase